MENKYWWVWLGIGVNLFYIVFINILIIICLAYLPGEPFLCHMDLCTALLHAVVIT